MELANLKKKRSLLDYIPSNLYFYYNFLKPILILNQKIKKNNYDYSDIINSSQLSTEACLKTGIKINITGREYLTSSAPRIIVANHMSSLETVILPYIVKDIGKISFVVKEELFKKKFFQYIMIGLRCIPMTRTNPRQDLLTLFSQSKDLIQENISIIIFPQKTRSIEFNPQEFNSIGCKLALKNNIPIQPVTLKTDFMSSSKFIKDFGKIDRTKQINFHFGKPINVNKQNQHDAHKQCINFISNTLKSLL